MSLVGCSLPSSSSSFKVRTPGSEVDYGVEPLLISLREQSQGASVAVQGHLSVNLVPRYVTLMRVNIMRTDLQKTLIFPIP